MNKFMNHLLIPTLIVPFCITGDEYKTQEIRDEVKKKEKEYIIKKLGGYFR